MLNLLGCLLKICLTKPSVLTTVSHSHHPNVFFFKSLFSHMHLFLLIQTWKGVALTVLCCLSPWIIRRGWRSESIFMVSMQSRVIQNRKRSNVLTLSLFKKTGCPIQVIKSVVRESRGFVFATVLVVTFCFWKISWSFFDLQDWSVCSSICLYLLRHYIHISDWYLSKVWLCKYFVKAPVFNPTVLL